MDFEKIGAYRMRIDSTVNYRLMDNGLKPVYVFDGKPPALKQGEVKKISEAMTLRLQSKTLCFLLVHQLEKRREKQASAVASMKDAVESGSWIPRLIRET